MNGPSLYNKKTGPVESTGKKSGNVGAYKKSTKLTLEEDAKLGQKLDNLETPSDVIDNKMNSPLPHKGYNKHGWPFKDETDHEKHHNMNENRDGNDAEGQPLKSGFKMKGSPMKRNFGIGAESPMKETTTTQPTYGGINIDPTSSYGYKDSTNIPSFRDMVSLEQQQAYADKVDKRRAERKEGKKKDDAEIIHRQNQDKYAPGPDFKKNAKDDKLQISPDGINIGDNEATDKSMGYRRVNGIQSQVERGAIDPESLGSVDGTNETYNTSSRPYTELEYEEDGQNRGDLIDESKYVTNLNEGNVVPSKDNVVQVNDKPKGRYGI